MSSLQCNCLKKNGEKCGKTVKYKYEFFKPNGNIIKYSCKLLLHKRSIVSELGYDDRLTIYSKRRNVFYHEYKNLTCLKCVDLFDTLFYQPHTKKQTFYKKYTKLQRKYHKELNKLEKAYPINEVEDYYRERNELETKMSIIMIPYVERGDYGKYTTELDLQNAVNDLNVMLLEKIDYIKKYEMCFYLNVMKNKDRYITAKDEYVSEFYKVKLLYVNKKEKECSICMNDINENSGGYLDCGHCFHNNCLGKWIKIKTDCPMCRKHFNKLKIMKSKYTEIY